MKTKMYWTYTKRYFNAKVNTVASFYLLPLELRFRDIVRYILFSMIQYSFLFFTIFRRTVVEIFNFGVIPTVHDSQTVQGVTLFYICG